MITIVPRLSVAVLGLALATHALAQPIRLATGPSNAVDGYLNVAPDEYGAWTQPFAGGAGPNDDNFNPAGTLPNGQPIPLRNVCFTSGFFLFVGTTDRELLSNSADWQAVSAAGVPAFNTDATLDRQVTAANVASDVTGDGVNDTLSSAFRVFNAAGTIDLAATLVQRVRSAAPGVAVMHQTYTFTNNAANPLSASLVRALDGDLIYTAVNYANDQVGTTCNAAGIGQFVFMREPDVDSTALTLYGGADGRYYYGGKQNHTPINGPPAMGYGTDVQVWVAYGVPPTWQNYIATVGYNVDGINGNVAGTADSFIGLDFELSLAPGASKTIRVSTTYGRPTPASIPCPGDLNGDFSVGLSDLTLLLASFGSSVGDPAYNPDADLDGNGSIGLTDLTLFLANFGASC